MVLLPDAPNQNLCSYKTIYTTKVQVRDMKYVMKF